MPINKPHSKPIYPITELDKEPNPVGIGLRYPHLVQFSEQQSVQIGWVGST